MEAPEDMPIRLRMMKRGYSFRYMNSWVLWRILYSPADFAGLDIQRLSGNVLDHHGHGQDFHLVIVPSAVRYACISKSHNWPWRCLHLLGSDGHHWNPAPLPSGDGYVGAEGYGEPS